jgi:hypothetical protein
MRSIDLNLPVVDFLSVLKGLVDILDSYSNLIIAFFTVVAATIAGLQLRESIRGPDLKLYFADERLAYVGPHYLTSQLDRAAGRMEVAIFFTLSLLLLNRSSKSGAISQLKLELLNPDPRFRAKSKVGEESCLFNFRFETEDAVQAPLVVSLQGNSSETIRIKCSITKTKISPRDSTPIDTDFIHGPIEIRARYLETRRNRLLPRKEEKQFRDNQKATYGVPEIDGYRKFLMV